MWDRVRTILFENLGLQLASLLLALLVYAHVVTEQERESVVQIPIAAVGLADTLTSVGELPPRVAVKVRGKWKDLIRLGLTRPFLSIDLAAAKPGMFRTSITADDISRRAIPPELSRLVSVTEVLDPRSVDLAIEPKATRSLPVRARIVGTPAPGYVLDQDPEVQPESVTVMGPAGPRNRHALQSQLTSPENRKSSARSRWHSRTWPTTRRAAASSPSGSPERDPTPCRTDRGSRRTRSKRGDRIR
jgi:hypothetical protein